MTLTLRFWEDGHYNELQVGNANNSLLSIIIRRDFLTVEQAQMDGSRIAMLLEEVYVID